MKFQITQDEKQYILKHRTTASAYEWFSIVIDLEGWENSTFAFNAIGLIADRLEKFNEDKYIHNPNVKRMVSELWGRDWHVFIGKSVKFGNFIVARTNYICEIYCLKSYLKQFMALINGIIPKYPEYSKDNVPYSRYIVPRKYSKIFDIIASSTTSSMTLGSADSAYLLNFDITLADNKYIAWANVISAISGRGGLSLSGGEISKKLRHYFTPYAPLEAKIIDSVNCGYVAALYCDNNKLTMLFQSKYFKNILKAVKKVAKMYNVPFTAIDHEKSHDPDDDIILRLISEEFGG